MPELRRSRRTVLALAAGAAGSMVLTACGTFSRGVELSADDPHREL